MGTARQSDLVKTCKPRSCLLERDFFFVKMSDAEWDADDFEPPKASAGAATGFKDKWDGEDEDDDVKAAWDASSEEEDSKSSENSVKAVQVKKKKKLHEIIAEKEAKKALG